MTKSQSLKQLKPAQLEILASAGGFARCLLGLNSYAWADRIFADLDQRGAKVAVKACNGGGKTERVAAPAALWHAAVFPRSTTICTAGVFRQVQQQLFPSIRQHAHRFRGGGWTFNDCEVITPTGSRILGFSTDDAGRFEGWHAENLLVIVDESKSVPDRIMEAIERCQPSRLLLLSSPGGCSGFFYDAFHSRRKFYTQHSVTAADCPHITQKWISEQIEKYGRDHPLVRSMIFAEFMNMGEDGAVIPLAFVERCLANPPARSEGTIKAFCDFAAGGDANVLAVRRGNLVTIPAAWREKDTMRAVGRFIQHFKDEKLKPDEISADEGGLGLVMCDALHEAGWPVRRVNNGSPAEKSDAYANKAAEMWFEGRRQIERCEIILPNDPELVGQLTSRLGWPNAKGKMELESKQDMRGRGLSSPDKADAVLGTLGQVATGGVSIITPTSRRLAGLVEDGYRLSNNTRRGGILIAGLLTATLCNPMLN